MLHIIVISVRSFPLILILPLNQSIMIVKDNYKP